MAEIQRIQSHLYRTPYSSLLSLIFAFFGIILVGSTYRQTFLPLFHYLPIKRWHSALSLVEFLLILTAFLHVGSLLMAFIATRSYKRPRFLGNSRVSCGRWTSSMTMAVMVLLAMVLLLVTVAFFGTAAAVRVVEIGMGHACETVPNSGDPSQVCLSLKPFGALDIMCGSDFESYCDFWSHKRRLNSLISGATLLLLANLLLLSCVVANFMRFRHNIIDDVIKGEVYVVPNEEEEPPHRKNQPTAFAS